MKATSAGSRSSDWWLTPPVRHRSLLLRGVSRSSKKKQHTCAALYATGVECSLSPMDGIRWCSRHNEERIKLYTSYKNHDALLKAFPDIPACQNVSTIKACDSLAVLRSWSAHLRSKYNLLTRCIVARVYFTRKFFGEDMDFGHKMYWDNLVRQRLDVVELMSLVEECGYRLILKEQNAMWVLEEIHKTERCPGHGDISRGTDTPLESADNVEDATTSDPLEAVLREKAMIFKERIRKHLAWYCAPTTSRYYEERLEIIYAYVRRAVYKDASLALLSRSYDSVMALLAPSDQVLDPMTMEKLWRAISKLCTHDIHYAVDDVMRSTDGDHVVVLGGRVFKDISGERWPLHAWGHMAAIRSCYGCVRSACRTIDQIIDLSRYALLTQSKLPQKYLKYHFSVDGSRELVLAGFIINDLPFAPPRHSVTSKDCGSYTVWEETECNPSLYAGLSLSDPKAQGFVNGCIRHPDLMVMLRKGANARIIRSSSVVWTSRKRHARSRLALADVPWEKTTDIVSLPDSALERAQPSGWVRTNLADCMQVIIVDAGKGTMSDFVRKLVEIWCQVYKVGNKTELYDALKNPYEAAGELEPFEEPSPEIVLDDYYPRLWGRSSGADS